ncbi:hypothetical protein ANANG_G00138460 [Anguilla anguilla]|uniref:Uncharacterized protein n=1 Tax=Anguilla anguilla TaxID=7936 RepID=A0A9D3MC15_ANGAN|nr:hypothetical protein ANANG_G00138460 [Anguilla anguilla]
MPNNWIWNVSSRLTQLITRALLLGNLVNAEQLELDHYAVSRPGGGLAVPDAALVPRGASCAQTKRETWWDPGRSGAVQSRTGPVARTLRYIGQDQRREGRLWTSPDEGGGTVSLPLRDCKARTRTGAGADSLSSYRAQQGLCVVTSGTSRTYSGRQSGPGRRPAA